jgi:hypothetical protein
MEMEGRKLCGREKIKMKINGRRNISNGGLAF